MQPHFNVHYCHWPVQTRGQKATYTELEEQVLLIQHLGSVSHWLFPYDSAVNAPGKHPNSCSSGPVPKHNQKALSVFWLIVHELMVSPAGTNNMLPAVK